MTLDLEPHTAPHATGRDRLRIAVQRKGRLAAPARELLAGCGLTWAESGDSLFCAVEGAPVDLLLVRDDDIPGLIVDGMCDLGVVGRNVLAEFSLDRAAAGLAGIEVYRSLGFGRCRLDIAVPEEESWVGPQQLAGRRIATSYPATVRAWLADQGVEAEVVTLAGSVEIAPRLGRADAVCDLVSSGATLAANQLRPVATVLHSEALLVGPAGPLDGPRAEMVQTLLRRLADAQRAQAARLLMLQVDRRDLDAVRPLLPAGEVPTVTTIDGQPEAVAVQVLAHGELGWQALERLKGAGARSLMVLPVEGMLL